MSKKNNNTATAELDNTDNQTIKSTEETDSIVNHDTETDETSALPKPTRARNEAIAPEKVRAAFKRIVDLIANPIVLQSVNQHDAALAGEFKTVLSESTDLVAKFPRERGTVANPQERVKELSAQINGILQNQAELVGNQAKLDELLELLEQKKRLQAKIDKQNEKAVK